MKIAAIIVTYNRKELLAECMEAVLGQTYPVDEVILIDNTSTDGTYEHVMGKNLIKDNVVYKRMKENLGGAGGFYTGIRCAYEKGADWIWIMDDDTIPMPSALEELILAINVIKDKNISYLASSVYGKSGEAMNVPDVDYSAEDGMYTDWYRYLDEGIVKINRATFVSLLINRNAVEKCGYPCKDYFIWGDDTEYTMRITKYYGHAYFVGKSVVIHKRNAAKPVFITDEDNVNRMKMHYYFVRNSLINTSEYNGKRARNHAILSYIHVCWTILLKKKHKAIKIKTILKALIDYSLKRYDFEAFNKRFLLDGQEKK